MHTYCCFSKIRNRAGAGDGDWDDLQACLLVRGLLHRRLLYIYFKDSEQCILYDVYKCTWGTTCLHSFQPTCITLSFSSRALPWSSLALSWWRFRKSYSNSHIYLSTWGTQTVPLGTWNVWRYRWFPRKVPHKWAGLQFESTIQRQGFSISFRCRSFLLSV